MLQYFPDWSVTQADQNQPEFPGTFALLHHEADMLMSEEAFSLCLQIFGNFQGHLMLNTADFPALLL